MNKMIKRRKDDGFTLIELMIVIAVIGILAVVLVPKVGTIKTQAKMSGVDTNIRTVQAYVQSRITSWNTSTTALDDTDIDADITSAFSGSSALTNPIDGLTTTSLTSGSTAAADTGTAGSVYVTTTDKAATIKIDAYDSAGNRMKDKTVTLTP